MKLVKWAAVLGFFGAVSFAIGFVRNMSYNSGSLVFNTKNNFYTFSVFPFDGRYNDGMENLQEALDDIFEDTMDEIEVDELNSMYYTND